MTKGYSDKEVFENLGNANYLNANYDEASIWYEKLLQTDGEIDTEYMYRYAQSLKSMGNYAKSAEWMKKFEAATENDLRASKYLNNSDYLEKIREQSGRYDFKNLGINSAASDFAPSFNDDQIVFSTARDSGIVARIIHKWNNRSFLNLYTAQVSEEGELINATRLSGILNKKTHESSTAFTKDGSTVYFTRNNSDNGSFSRDEEGVSRLKIYRATMNNGVWSDIFELPFNGDSYSVAHPALSADDSKLYFASDMEGTLGESDLFVVDINSDGNFGTPVNLGNKINTEARETFPYVTESDVLYFASDGHPGLGGLDVFATKIGNEDDIYVVNVGGPVNSEEDDFSFIVNESSKTGYFASNREGGLGNDDIYSFIEKEPIDLICNTTVDGIVKDQETGYPLSGAKVTILNDQKEIVAETISANDGSFTLDGDCKDGSYTITAIKEDYNDGNEIFTIVNANDSSGIEVELEKTIRRAPVGSDLVKFLNLEPVYFDLDKSAIRPDAEVTLNKVIEYMGIFNDIKVEVQSHTDAKAGKRYNDRLSNRRAKETVKYLVDRGIEETRITGKGFGETQLTNDCTTRESCPDEKHQENRRSEFIVIE
ncbi:OmpA family protein [Maribacter halichondriae]|uniref:OmpA family protein n=1 Tax=Maribacter halichondriae TaxID=2980554 RepID=UPI002358D55D|nr:OmpA family protein [Maribacter sp. Hal144]